MLSHNTEIGTTCAEWQQFGTDMESQVDLAGKFIRKDGIVLYNFGKYKGCPVFDHPDYLDWMMKGSFPADTRDWVFKLSREHNETMRATYQASLARDAKNEDDSWLLDGGDIITDEEKDLINKL
jgi:hypothetical protein